MTDLILGIFIGIGVVFAIMVVFYVYVIGKLMKGDWE